MDAILATDLDLIDRMETHVNSASILAEARARQLQEAKEKALEERYFLGEALIRLLKQRGASVLTNPEYHKVAKSIYSLIRSPWEDRADNASAVEAAVTAAIKAEVPVSAVVGTGVTSFRVTVESIALEDDSTREQVADFLALLQETYTETQGHDYLDLMVCRRHDDMEGFATDNVKIARSQNGAWFAYISKDGRYSREFVPKGMALSDYLRAFIGG